MSSRKRRLPKERRLRVSLMALSREARAIRQANPCCFVIFGASGDLTARLLMPAIYRLAAQKRLPEAFAIIGLAHSHRSDDEFRATLKKALEEHLSEKIDSNTIAWLLERSCYVSGEFEDPAAYDRLDDALKRIESERVGAVVARGDAELGFQQVSELLPIAGIDYVGLLPGEVQQVSIVSAAIATRSKARARTLRRRVIPSPTPRTTPSKNPSSGRYGMGPRLRGGGPFSLFGRCRFSGGGARGTPLGKPDADQPQFVEQA